MSHFLIKSNREPLGNGPRTSPASPGPASWRKPWKKKKNQGFPEKPPKPLIFTALGEF